MKNELKNGDIVDVTYITYTTCRPKPRTLKNLIFVKKEHFEETECCVTTDYYHFLQNDKNFYLNIYDILVIKKH